jgi:hypothetical protein
MKWINYKGGDLKQGVICRTVDGEFIMVGEINTSLGTNDEFTESITHYTEYFCNDILSKLKYAKLNYDK